LITRARDDPALLDEWMKPLTQKGQPLWDKVITTSYVWLVAGCMILIGFDAGRFHWSAMPAGLRWLGACGILISLWNRSWIFQVNRFLAPVVKIQTERVHEVITKGPMPISGIRFMPRICSFFLRRRLCWALGLASRRRSCPLAH